MKSTKLIILAATAAFVLNASAKLPSGYESVVLKATLMGESGNKIVKAKITTDDILSLIDNEYGTSYSKKDGGKGYQLVSYGVGYDYDGYDIFAVMDKTGSIVLENASFHGSSETNDYELYLYPYEDGNYIYTYKGEKYTWYVPNVEVYYNSSDDNDSFDVYGTMTDKVDYTTDSENYSIKNGSGSFDFGDEDVYGPVTGVGVSGSGTDVDPYDE